MALPILRRQMEPVGHRLRRPVPPLASLAATGLFSLAIYAWFVVRYPLSAHLQWPRGGWFPPQGADLPSLILHLFAYAGLFLAYLAAIRLSGSSVLRGPRLLRTGATILALWLAASLLLLWVTPSGDSHDVFDYLYRGRVWVEQGASPLAVAPNELPRQPFYHYTAWKKHVDTYGPVWEYTSGGVSLAVRQWLKLSGRELPGEISCPDVPSSCRVLVAYITGYRLLAIFLASVSGGLIGSVVRRQDRRLVVPALLIWFWNPLLITSTALGAHNDALLLALLLAAFWCCQRRWWLAGLLFLVLSAHVKLTGLIWMPIFGLWLWRQIGLRRSLRVGAAAAAIALPLSWLLYWPLGGWATLSRMLPERMLFVANSPWQLLHYWLDTVQNWPLQRARFYAMRVPTILFGVLGLVVPAWLLLRRAGDRRDTHQSLWVASVTVAMLYLLVGSFWFQHWYVMWVLAPAALLPNHPFTRRVLPWLCFGALSSNILYDTISRLPSMAVSVPTLQATVLAAIWLPPALIAVVGWWQWHRRLAADRKKVAGRESVTDLEI